MKECPGRELCSKVTTCSLHDKDQSALHLLIGILLISVIVRDLS